MGGLYLVFRKLCPNSVQLDPSQHLNHSLPPLFVATQTTLPPNMRFSTLAANALIGGAALALTLPATTTETCCCCNGREITCRPNVAAGECICLAIWCPPDVPVVWIDVGEPELPETPPADALPAEAEAASKVTDEVDVRGQDCCCCNIGKKEISCKRQALSDGCYCPAVVCPEDATVVWK